MTKKTENEGAKKSGAKITSDQSARPARQQLLHVDSRAYLLARVASNVATGIVSAPSASTTTAVGIAEIAVDIAEEILKKAGL